jgi:hypothetical protein
MLLKARSRKPLRPHVRVGCAFCWQWIPAPERLAAYDPSGAWGGCCPCGAWFVLDENGKQGGQSLLELCTLAVGGDLDRAVTLREGVDYELRHKPMIERVVRMGAQAQAPTIEPKVWFLKLRSSSEER